MLLVVNLLHAELASRVMPRVLAALLRDAAGKLPLVAIFDAILHTGIMPTQSPCWKRALPLFRSVSVAACMCTGFLLALGIIAPSAVARALSAGSSEKPSRMPVGPVKWFSRCMDSLFLR
jgi:hypothetical protein